ncbi:MAG TPA: aminopeptidase P N-terminal domain-containing protein [Gammaproteobacteria bacterium]|nr:aminopeptidase P N-terminal domain-containing protein [Gammaproteobacteria bacterium]
MRRLWTCIESEANPVVNSKEFARRRKYLMELIGANGIAVLAAAPERVRSRDTLHIYRADSDFYYLTGFAEPEAVAVLVPGREQGQFLMFCRERNPERELWDGPRAGPEGVVADYGADDAFPITDLDDILPGLLERSERVYCSLGAHEFDQRLLSFLQTLNSKRQSSGHAPSELVALDHLLHEMRLFKSRAEVAVMRQSAKIAVAAHRRAMLAVRPGMKEFELEAEFLHEFRRHGAECSYPPIVAGGSNACVLHYRSNDAELKDGDLVLIDAGCEHGMYASDITRTFPVNGRFTEPQRELYELVLEANQVATTKAVPGNHWNDPHDAAVGVITRGLKELGLLEGRVPQLVKSLAYKRFFMHRTGHWLGLDVHDVGDYKLDEQWRMLEPGMVMTIEPGIYVAPGEKSVDKRWRGIGIRIEDDVHVSREGPDVLTGGLPATVEQIERHMAGAA